MENKDLLELVKSKAQVWLTESYDAETRAQVQALLDSEDPTELIECFYKDLEFGTGGLRGIMGVGSNRMNIYTVGAAGSLQLPEAGVCRLGADQGGDWTRLPQQQP